MEHKGLIQRKTADKSICHGKPVIRGMRYPVELILDLLPSGMAGEEILSDYPSLEMDDIRAFIAYASHISKVKSYANFA